MHSHMAERLDLVRYNFGPLLLQLIRCALQAELPDEIMSEQLCPLLCSRLGPVGIITAG